MKKKNLSTFYYLDHFREMLSFNLRVNSDLLFPPHTEFITRFEGLSRDAQCLYIRMANRKHTIFTRQSLNYDEIKDKLAAGRELHKVGLIRELEAIDYVDLLMVFTKPQLVDLVGKTFLTAIKTSWSKAKILDSLIEQVPYEQAKPFLVTSDYWVQAQQANLDYLLFLYFGSPELDLKQFALRDLGIIRVNQNTEFSARFNSRQEALSCFRLTQIRELVRKEDIVDPAKLITELTNLDEQDAGPVSRLRDKTLYELARWFESHQQLDYALKLMRESNLTSSQKRYIRLQYSQDPELARRYLESLPTLPINDELSLFAKDFYARKFGTEHLSLHTSRLREGGWIRLDDSYRNSAERGLIDHFKQRGWTAWFTENHLWRSLFGLAFWELLFEDQRSVHSNFDRLPQSLRDKSFAIVFKSEIGKVLEALAQGRGMLTLVRTITAHYGQPNGLFRWQKFRLEPIQTLLTPSFREATTTILRKMVEDYPSMKDGFPDLMISCGNQLHFIEVKADGDQLRQNQLARLHQLQAAGFNCEISRVSYTYNPNQLYVVVDVETTGGKKPHHRITEIGAVKIQDGQIIDEFQTLVNPERPIPANIIQLTGITNQMVAKAPTFAEIADNFKEFLQGSVFVAHNVNFDYGFLQLEYERLAKPFRFPKFCTVVNTRKHYPGLKSYSLANLCSYFDIPLTQHHRALADAKATAQLLLLINDKRTQDSENHT